MDSFTLIYLVELVQVGLAEKRPAWWRAIHLRVDWVVGVYRRGSVMRKGVMVAALVWLACYAAVLPWMALQLDPPVLTALVAGAGSIMALLIYSWWGITSAGSVLRQRSGKY